MPLKHTCSHPGSANGNGCYSSLFNAFKADRKSLASGVFTAPEHLILRQVQFSAKRTIF